MQDQRQFGYDDVNGVCVGGDYVKWCIVYEDRPQSGMMWAATTEEAMQEAARMVEELRYRWKGICYPDKDAWTIRIYE